VAASAAVVVFASWRTGQGALAGFGLLVLASAVSWRPAPHEGALLLPLGVLELLGWVTLAYAAHASEGRRLSRRLLGAWLASSGLAGFGVSLGGTHAAAGSALVAAGLAYKLGVMPVFSWAPLLLRHPSRRVAALGVVAFGAVLLATVLVLPAVPDAASARTTLRVLSAVTIPWSLWHAIRQWPKDKRCARSYALVAVGGALLFTI
jgi:hypothetical protein